MKSKWIIFLPILLILAGCNRVSSVINPKIGTPYPRPNINQDSMALAQINEIYADKNINLNIYKNARNEKIILVGSDIDKKTIRITQKNHVLFIEGKPKHPITANLYLGPLYVMNLRGDATVSFHGSNKLMKLATNNNINVTHLYNYSSQFTIEQRDKSAINLFGSTKILNSELWNSSYLNAKNFRTIRSFVKTHDHATAYINSTLRQHALASNASDIYYEKNPEIKSEFMGFNGSVLQLRPSKNYQKDLK
jgi:hypothetical protein